MLANHTIKNNEVLVDGVSVGTVEKIVHDGLWATAYGVRAGGTEWKGTAPDGTVFDGLDKRKDAAARLVRYAEPLTVSSIGIEDYCGRRYIKAMVSWQGNSASVSQYPGEDYWVVDAFWTTGSIMPVWANGGGSRVTRARVLAGEQLDAVNAAVAESGITVSED